MAAPRAWPCEASGPVQRAWIAAHKRCDQPARRFFAFAVGVRAWRYEARCAKHGRPDGSVRVPRREFVAARAVEGLAR